MSGKKKNPLMWVLIVAAICLFRCGSDKPEETGETATIETETAVENGTNEETEAEKAEAFEELEESEESEESEEIEEIEEAQAEECVEETPEGQIPEEKATEAPAPDEVHEEEDAPMLPPEQEVIAESIPEVQTESVPEAQAESVQPVVESPVVEAGYILNTNTMKIHSIYCGYAEEIKPENKGAFSGDPQELINQGYTYCKRCLG